mmetsp:Transcript_5224/g.11013  ORF Transcript_5224/g.11013 Transcript_5224/m.11013 type:complete len:623 (-) Transcript_5224:64-1932(-)
MIASSEHSRAGSGCIGTRHATHQLDQEDHEGDTSTTDNCATSSSQSHHHGDATDFDKSEADFEISVATVEEVVRQPRCDIAPTPASDGFSGHQKDRKVLQNTTAAEEDNVQPLAIQLPITAPLGIDIDMVLPIVSYIQPYSPLIQHVKVGDILIHINGKNVFNLTHVELCSMLNGASRKSKKKNGSDEVEVQREWAKLVFLPAQYRKKLHKQDDATKQQTTVEQPKQDQKSRTGQQVDTGDVESCDSVHGKSRVEERVDQVDEKSIVKEQASEEISATSLVEPSNEDDRGSVGKSHPSLLDGVQQQHDDQSITPSTPHTPSSKQVLINDDNKLLTNKPSLFKYSISDSSPITATTRTSLSSNESRDSSYVKAKEGQDDADLPTSCRGISFLDYLEKIVEEKKENMHQPIVDVDEGHQESTQIMCSDKCTGKEYTKSTDEHVPKNCNEEDEEPERHLAEEYKGTEHVTNTVEEDVRQSKSDQDNELNDRDQRRLERMNRAQPKIEFLSISNDPDCVEDVSTLFGGVWNKQLHYAAHRVEDNMLHHMEGGGAGHNTVLNGCSHQRLARGVNTHRYHAEKKMKDEEDPSWFNNKRRQQVMTERALIALCILSAVGLVTFLVVVLR